MTFKSIALAAAMFALPLALTGSIAGGSALAMNLGTGGGGGSAGGSAGGSDGGGNVEHGVSSAFCIPANTSNSDAARLQAKNGCPKTVTLRIGTLRLN